MIWTRSRRRREVEDGADSYVDSLKSPPQQQSRVEFEEFRAALQSCRPTQREALLLTNLRVRYWRNILLRLLRTASVIRAGYATALYWPWLKQISEPHRCPLR